MAVILNFPAPSGSTEPDEEIVDMLEALLDQARSGELQSIVLVTANGDGTPAVNLKMDRGAGAAIIGALKIAEKRIIDALEIIAIPTTE